MPGSSVGWLDSPRTPTSAFKRNRNTQNRDKYQELSVFQRIINVSLEHGETENTKAKLRTDGDGRSKTEGDKNDTTAHPIPDGKGDNLGTMGLPTAEAEQLSPLAGGTPRPAATDQRTATCSQVWIIPDTATMPVPAALPHVSSHHRLE